MLVYNNLAYASTSKRETIYLYDLFDRYLKSLSEKSAKMLKSYTNDFKKFIDNKDIATITVDDIQFIIDSKKAQNLKDSTLYRYYSILQTIFNYAVSHKYINENPCHGVTVKHVKCSETRNIDYSKKYIRKLLKAFKHSKIYYIVLIAIHTRYA